MSHFSRIKTIIRDLNILQKTLVHLDLDFSCGKYCIKDYYGNVQTVDIIVRGNDNYTYGFKWNEKEYILLADLQLWNQKISVERFIENITQYYAYNSIVDVSKSEGFNHIDKQILEDGSIKLVIQRWNY